MIRINKNLALFSVLFLLLGSLLGISLFKSSPLIGHITYYCQSLATTYMVPIPFYLNVIPFSLLFIIFAVSVGKFIFFCGKIWFHKYNLRKNVVYDKQVEILVKKLKLKDSVVLIRSQKPFAFCLGIIHPKIYISTSLLTKLTRSEVEGVLRHEQYHVQNYDPMTLFIGSFAHSLFPFFPLVTDLLKKYRIEREIAADQFAVSHLRSPAPVVSALKKLLIYQTNPLFITAAIAEQDTLEPRIHALLHKPYAKRYFSLIHVSTTLLCASIFIAMLVIPVHAKEIHHETHDLMMVCTDGTCMNSCVSQQNLTKLYSEMPSSKKP